MKKYFKNETELSKTEFIAAIQENIDNVSPMFSGVGLADLFKSTIESLISDNYIQIGKNIYKIKSK